MSKQPQPPVYSGVPDPSSWGRAKCPADAWLLRHNFISLAELRQKCPATTLSLTDFLKALASPLSGASRRLSLFTAGWQASACQRR